MKTLALMKTAQSKDCATYTLHVGSTRDDEEQMVLDKPLLLLVVPKNTEARLQRVVKVRFEFYHVVFTLYFSDRVHKAVRCLPADGLNLRALSGPDERLVFGLNANRQCMDRIEFSDKVRRIALLRLEKVVVVPSRYVVYDKAFELD